MARVEQVKRRRLDDIVEEAFQHACLIGDLETASQLIDVLAQKHKRWRRQHNSDRRGDDERVPRLQEELARRERVRAAEGSTTAKRPGIDDEW